MEITDFIRVVNNKHKDYSKDLKQYLIGQKKLDYDDWNKLEKKIKIKKDHTFGILKKLEKNNKTTYFI